MVNLAKTADLGSSSASPDATIPRIIGGNGRLVAMRALNWTECDVVELDLDDLQATALGIALNRMAELAEWDEPVLARLLEELRAEDALLRPIRPSFAPCSRIRHRQMQSQADKESRRSSVSLRTEARFQASPADK